MPEPKTGSHSSRTAKTQISIRASQKMGTAWPATARIIARRSTTVPRLSAETIPAGMAMAMASASAAAASSMVRGNRSRMSWATGRLCRSEVPRSPAAARDR